MHSVNSMIRLLSKISISLASFFFNIYDIEEKKFFALNSKSTPKLKPPKLDPEKF